MGTLIGTRIKEGAQFVLVGQGDSVILKSIESPPMDQFKSLVAQVRKAAHQEGLKQLMTASKSS